MSKLYFKVASDWQEVVRLRTEVDRLEKQLRSMDANKAPQAVAVLNKQIIESKQQLRGMVDEAAKAGAVMEKDFKSKIFQGSKAVNDFTDKIIKQKGVVKDVEADVRRLANAYKSVRNNPLKASNTLSELNSARRVLDEEKASLFGLQQEQSKARLSVKKLRDEYALYNDDSRHVVDTNGGMAISFGKVLGTAAVSGFMRQLTSVRGMFQKYEAVLANAFDGDKGKAKDTMSEIGVFAAKTNFQLDELTDNFIKLVNRGVTPTMDTLGKLGDFANTTAKPMAQLNEAILDINNPERWKEFGVQVSTQGDRVNLTFRGMTIQAERSVDSVMKAIEQFGSMKGVAGSTAAIAGTIEGQMSNLEDTITTVFNKIGENSEGFISESISLTSDLISNYEIIGKILGGLIATYGAYRTAIIVCNLVEKIGASIKLESALAGHALTTSQGLAAVATKQLTAAQLMLNKAMLSNPYVLAATLVTGLIAATVILTDTTTATSRAQQEFNDRLNTYNQYLSEEKKRVGDLSSKIKDENLSREERHKAYKALITISPVVFGKYKTEKELIDNMTKALREFNQEQENKLKLMNLHNSKQDRSDLDELKKLKELYLKKQASGTLSVDENKQLKELYGKYNVSKARDKGTYRTSELTAIDDLILAQYKKIGAGQTLLRKQNQTSWELTLDGMSKDTAIALRKHYEESKKTYKGYKWFSIGESAPVNEKILDDRIKQLNTKVINVEKKGANDYIEEAKKAWDEAKKEVEKVKKGSYKTASDYDSALKKAQENEKEKKELYEKRRGTTDKELSKQESDADRLRKETEQYKLLLSKQQLDKVRAQEDMQMQVDEARINAMKDGADKTIAQMELNFEKEMQAVDRQKEDLLRKKIDDARDAYNAKLGNKKGAFDGSKIKLSDEENRQFSEMYERVIDKNSNAFDGLIAQYQDYTDKRLSIERKYDNDIRVLDEARRKAAAGGNSEEVARIDRAKAESTKNKGKDLMTLDYEKLKESPDYIRAFENLKYTSSETLNSLLDQLESAKSTAAKVLSPDQLREYTTSIQSIMDELEQRNPFGMLAKHKEELAEAEEALATAKANLDKANADAEAVNDGAKIENGSKSSYNPKTGKIDITKSYLTEAQAVERVTAATQEYSAAKDDTTKKSAKVKETEKVTTEQIKKLGGAVKEVGDAIGGEAGAIIGMIGDIGTFAMTAVEGVKTAADTSATAVSTVEKASVILAIISAAIQLATKVASFFAADYSDYNKAKENYESYVKVLDVVIEKQKELIETMTGEAAIQASERALADIEKIAEASRRIGKERLDSGASAGSHAIGNRVIKRMNDRDWADARRALGAEFDAHNISGGRMKGLFDLSIEQLEKLQREAPAFWGKLDEDTKEYLETIIETGKKSQEIIDATNERFTGISFDSFKDNWVETLFDMNTSSQDFAKNFEEYLKKAIINSMIVDKYKSKINELYKTFSKDAQSDNKLTESEVNALKKQQQDLTDKMLKEREELAKVFDWNTSDTSDSAKSGGFQSMSQDTGNELNGRFTAMQISGEEIKAQNLIQSQSLNMLTVKAEDIIRINSETRNIADDLRDIQAKSYLELVEIRDNTGETVKQLKSVNERLGKIESNTNGL